MPHSKRGEKPGENHGDGSIGCPEGSQRNTSPWSPAPAMESGVFLRAKKCGAGQRRTGEGGESMEINDQKVHGGAAGHINGEGAGRGGGGFRKGGAGGENEGEAPVFTGARV